MVVGRIEEPLDLAVVGAGPGGYAAALRAAQHADVDNINLSIIAMDLVFFTSYQRFFKNIDSESITEFIFDFSDG